MAFELNNITLFKADGARLFSPVTLTVKAGEIATIMGPSGCGKSTLLNAIAGHLADEFDFSGDIVLNDQSLKNVAPHKRRVGILFQDDLLFPHLNVWQNLAFALPNEIKKSERQQAALQALANIELSELAESYPEQISGGQRARISLTRMLLAKPKLALLDEPFSKLDMALRARFREWVFEQLRNANIPTILVTHDPQDSCGKVYRLDHSSFAESSAQGF